MVVFPNAKINLGLNIVSKRSDGYHDIETLFYPIGLHDVLEVVPAAGGRTRMQVSGIPVEGADADNLVLKAYRLMQECYDLPPVEISLYKAIPLGAGLGGGSADAAFMLRLLDRMFALSLSDEQLAALAVKIGADCPFFLYNRPLLATGIGNVFRPVSLSLRGHTLVLVKPDVHVSTAEAYRAVRPQKPRVRIPAVVEKPLGEWSGLLVNDFEERVFAAHPVIGRIKEDLYRAGAGYVSLSGSGASVYGLFDKPADVAGLFPGSFIWQGECEI